MFNPEFDYAKLLSTRDFLNHEKLHRWVSLDQEIKEKTFYDVSFLNCNWLNTQFSCSRFLNCSFIDITINHSSFLNCFFENVVFDQWTIRNTRFEHCVFIACQFKPNELVDELIDRISFKHSYLNRCNLGSLPKLLEDKNCLDALEECLLFQTPIQGPLTQNIHLLAETPKQEPPVRANPSPTVQSSPTPSPPHVSGSKTQSELGSKHLSTGLMNRFNQLEIDSKEKQT
jgi:hypothetical protein